MNSIVSKSDITISAQTLHYHIERFRARGGVMPEQSVFERWGVNAEELLESDQRFPIEIMGAAIQFASQQLDDPVLGLNHIDQDNSFYTEFGRVLSQNADSLETFIRLCSRYFCLFTEIGTFEIKHSNPLTEVTFNSRARHLLSYHQVDGALLVLKQGIENFCGIHPEQVSVDHECPDECEIHYQAKFVSDVFFQQPQSSLYFRTEDVIKPMSADIVDMQVGQLMPASLESKRDQLYGKDVIEKTAFLIRRLLILGEPSREQVANELAMSLRSFQRTLSQQKTTYKALLESTRKDMAMELIQQSTFTIQQIALLLGYSETSQFYKAFKRWFDYSPNHYRSSSYQS